MDIIKITSSDKMWNKVRDYAKDCSWNAGKSLANAMDNHLFTERDEIHVFFILFFIDAAMVSVYNLTQLGFGRRS